MKRSIIFTIIALLGTLCSFSQITVENGKIRVGEPFNGADWDIQFNGFNAFFWNSWQFQLSGYNYMVMSGPFDLTFKNPDDASKPSQADRFNSIRVMRIYSRNDYPRVPYDQVPDFDSVHNPRLLSAGGTTTEETRVSANPIEQISTLVNGLQMLSKKMAENGAALSALSSSMPDGISDGKIETLTLDGSTLRITVSAPELTDNRIIITDLSGNVQKSAKCSSTTIEFDNSEIRKGNHIVTLLCNGKIADSRKFVN